MTHRIRYLCLRTVGVVQTMQCLGRIAVRQSVLPSGPSVSQIESMRTTFPSSNPLTLAQNDPGMDGRLSKQLTNQAKRLSFRSLRVMSSGEQTRRAGTDGLGEHRSLRIAFACIREPGSLTSYHSSNICTDCTPLFSCAIEHQRICY